MGALRRLQLTPMTSIDLLGGITLALALIGALSIALAFGVAVLLGFRSLGPLWVAILVGTIASLSVIGMGMVVALHSHGFAGVHRCQLSPGADDVLLGRDLSHAKGHHVHSGWT
jgi:hypothetical protein